MPALWDFLVYKLQEVLLRIRFWFQEEMRYEWRFNRVHDIEVIIGTPIYIPHSCCSWCVSTGCTPSGEDGPGEGRSWSQQDAALKQQVRVLNIVHYNRARAHFLDCWLGILLLFSSIAHMIMTYNFCGRITMTSFGSHRYMKNLQCHKIKRSSDAVWQVLRLE